MVTSIPCLIQAAEGMRPLRIPLGQGITITEVDSEGKAHNLTDPSDNHAIDVNSTILLRIDSPSLASSLPRPLEGGGTTSPLDPSIVEQRQRLLDALSTLNDYLRVSGKIAELFAQNLASQSIPEMDGVMAQHGRLYLEIQTKLEQYLATKTSQGSQTKSPVEQVEDLFDGTISQWSARVRAFIHEEVRRLDRGSTNRLTEIKANANPFSLEMAAHLTRNGERVGRVHLPGYDSFEEGEYRPIDKISFSMSEKEKAGLQSEMEFHRNLSSRLNETQSLKQGLEATLHHFVDQAVDRFRTFLEAADQTSRETQDLLKFEISAGIPASFAALESTTKNLAEAPLRRARGLSNGSLVAIREFQADMQRIVPSAVRLTALRETQDPLVAMDQLTRLVTVTPSEIEAAYRRLTHQFEVAQTSYTVALGEFKATAASLPAPVGQTINAQIGKHQAAGEEIKKKLSAFYQSQLSPLLASIENLKNRAGSVKASAQKGLAIGEGLDPSLMEDKTIIRSFEDIVDTKFNVVTSGRQTGDQIQLKVAARQAATGGVSSTDSARSLGDRTITFKLEKFGAYSEFSAGAAAFFNSDASKEAQFGAVTSWVLHCRSRSNQTWNTINPGLGFHTAGISTGLGLGASLHFLPGNLLQVGGGHTMRSAGNNRWYWFVGLRLANFKMPGMNN